MYTKVFYTNRTRSRAPINVYMYLYIYISIYIYIYIYKTVIIYIIYILYLTKKPYTHGGKGVLLTARKEIYASVMKTWQ